MPTRFQQRFRRRLFLTAGLAALLLFSFAACDSSGDDEDEVDLPEDTFEATVGGDVSAELSGKALYAVVGDDPDPSPNPAEPDTLFQIGMVSTVDSDSSDRDTSLVLLARPSDKIPDEGTYEIVTEADTVTDMPEGAFGGAFISQADSAFFVSQSGTLEITRAGNGRLVGTFEFEGVEFALFGSPGDARARIEGAFHATQTEEPALPQSNEALRQAAQ